MSTHNLCFGVKIRKIGIHLLTPVLEYNIGVKWSWGIMERTLHGHVFLMLREHFVSRMSVFPTGGHSLILTQYMKTYIRCKQHKNSTPWNNQ